jgi:hypothetical protein
MSDWRQNPDLVEIFEGICVALHLLIEADREHEEDARQVERAE